MIDIVFMLRNYPLGCTVSIEANSPDG